MLTIGRPSRMDGESFSHFDLFEVIELDDLLELAKTQSTWASSSRVS